MDERLFAALAKWLTDGPVVLASVLHTRGATPRKRGSRMLFAARGECGSVGGGAAEARVRSMAGDLLAQPDGRSATVDVALDGRPGADGVCGGRMQVALRCWHGAADAARAHALAAALAAGDSVELSARECGDDHPDAPAQMLLPNPRLVIVGAGHCGLALHEMARLLDFDTWVHDERPGCFSGGHFTGARVLCGEPALLAQTADTARARLAVLLTRDFRRDVAALEVLLRNPPGFIGMMGSRRRIAEVRAALPQQAGALQRIHAPVGLAIGAETPHEIAVSILAQLVQQRGTPLGG